MRLSASARLLVCALALSIVGCDDDDGNGGDGDGAGDADGDGDGDGVEPPENSGVPPERQLSQLTDEDVQKLCVFERDTYKAYLPSEEAFCFASLTDSEDCAAELEDCMETAVYEENLDDDWDCDQATVENYFADISDCPATVGDLESCVSTDNELYWAFYANASCEDPDSFEAPAYADECLELFDACPDLLPPVMAEMSP